MSTPTSSGFTISPEPFSEKTAYEKTADFLQNVLPPTVVSKPVVEERDTVTWVRFEESDVNDPRLLTAERNDLQGRISSPLLLVIGYSNGYQIWLLQADGHAKEIVSERGVSLRSLRILRTPLASRVNDQLVHHRPVMALVHTPTTVTKIKSEGNTDCKSDGKSEVKTEVQHNVSFQSMKSGESVGDPLPFVSPVLDVQSNHSVVVVCTHRKIVVLSAATLAPWIFIRDSHFVADLMVNPVALGNQWLAYSPQKFISGLQSSGGLFLANNDSYTAAVLDAAKAGASVIGQGWNMIGSYLSGKQTQVSPDKSLAGAEEGQQEKEGASLQADSGMPGLVAVFDVVSLIQAIQLPSGGKPLKFTLAANSTPRDFIKAHFIAHAKESISAMSFNPSQYLLVTCSVTGRHFHIFSILPHPVQPAMSAVQHLYTLHRGDTEATVQNIAFTPDSRWLAVSTLRGTTHVFPITPYGGPISSRTHSQPRVPNRHGRFETSAGLSEARPRPVNVCSPSPSTPSLTSAYAASSSQSVVMSSLGGRLLPNGPAFPGPRDTVGNTRYANCIEEPVVLTPLVQVKHFSLLGNQSYGNSGTLVTATTGLVSTFANLTMKTSPAACAPPPLAHSIADIYVAATFGAPTFGAPHCLIKDGRRARSAPSIHESLFVITSESRLIEHRLDVLAGQTPNSISLSDTPIQSWDLRRLSSWPEIRLPLSRDSVLLKRCHLASKLTSSEAMKQAFCRVQESSPSRHSRTSYGHDADQVLALSGSSISSGSLSEDDKERWQTHIEVGTCAAPNRRLWMGPQFQFATLAVTESADSTLHNASQQSDHATLRMETLRGVPRNFVRSTPVAVVSQQKDTPLPGCDVFEYGSLTESYPHRGSLSSSQSSRDVENLLKEAMETNISHSSSPDNWSSHMQGEIVEFPVEGPLSSSPIQSVMIVKQSQTSFMPHESDFPVRSQTKGVHDAEHF